ncbi:ABC transporter permease [Sulfuriferula sp. GW1]|uniref:ABC transporter permease n=1 Tax=Sulfuriferula sp. GW1 TaxID=3345111 RepID=UPI0039AF91A3
MNLLDKKLLRDLWRMRSQAFTIALVVAAGIAGFIGSLSTYDSMQWSRASYYDAARFADVFAELKRAPKAIERRIAEIPGVADVQSTVQFDVTLDIPGIAEPVVGRMIGLPEGGQPRLNRIFIRQGRMPEAGQAHEVVVSEGFASVRHLKPGATLAALINGKRETLKIVGIGLSPEYVFATRGGAFPDDRGFGVLWIDRVHLATAFNMEGAFNHVAVKLAPGASERVVIDALDRLLEPYGGLHAYGRSDQVSNKILTQEIGQQKVMGTTLPLPFFGVAIFLLNVVLSRIVSTQREQIAALKALGYGNAAIATHYLKFVLVITLLGIVIGVLVGAWFGHYMTRMYTDFFHFPHLAYRMQPWIPLLAGGISLLAAVAGALSTVHQVVVLAPAQAMHPPSPPRYRKMLLERLGLVHWLSPAARMVIRNMERHPLRVLVTIFGIAISVAVILSGTFWRDAVNYLIYVQFEAVQRADAEVVFNEPMAARVRHEIAHAPGVRETEVSRIVPVRLVSGHLSYRTVIQGIPQDARLHRLLDANLRSVPLPRAGILLTDRLAQRLNVHAGDTLWVESLESTRRKREVVVAGTVGELIGLSAYMEIGALNRFMGESDVVSGISVALDKSREKDFFAYLKGHPKIATSGSKTAMLQSFKETSAKNVLFFTTIFTGFAAVIAFGVVYNSARIALAERAWELASLRVLGFTRREVSAFLLGELAIEIVLAIPLGFPLGYFIAWGLIQLMPHETLVLPVIIQPDTYAYAGIAILLAGTVSALIVRHRVDRLDLVAVLKTRE